jgi:hypothetical protein
MPPRPCDKVGADVSGLGEDAAADAGEEGNGAGAESEAVYDDRVAEDDVQGRNAKKAEADHGHAHDRSRPEGNAESLVEAVAGGFVVRRSIWWWRSCRHSPAMA